MNTTVLISLVLTITLVQANVKKLERNNVVNKGLWVRNKADINPGDFIFRANSLDVDSVLQNNFDAFGENNVQNSPFFTNYVERNKRSSDHKTKHHKASNSSIKRKLISTLKPASVFNDYPYEVAALLNDDKQEILKQDEYRDIKNIKVNTTPLSNIIKGTDVNEDSTKSNIDNITAAVSENNTKNSVMPKRSMHDSEFENELIKKIEFTEVLNKTDTLSKKELNVFDKEDIAWQTAPVPNINVYKIVPKPKENIKNKPISERGLLKVLSMLTKSFKKVMKQHNDIKKIHRRLYNLNNDFVKNVDVFTNKFEDFNLKYYEILKIIDDLKQMQSKSSDKEKKIVTKEKVLSKSLKEFENQQKKFIEQQRQFFNVQKLMLAQNEKINMKQNLIAKTQTDISHKQNNFARILNKAKQIYVDTKHSNPQLQTAIIKPKIKVNEKIEPEKIATTTYFPTTDSVKINLFSIPTIKQIENQDKNLLQERDFQEIDDLIYKYYFNNTFIDEIMKNKILSTFLSATADTNKKIKRNEDKLNITILLPVNFTDKGNNIHNKYRKRRWIKHSKKNIHTKTTLRPIKKIIVADYTKKISNGAKIDLKNDNKDPFTTMALNFCKEIGQDTNIQLLNWCVEKAIRRLQVIDFNKTLVIPPPKLNEKHLENNSTGTTAFTGPSTVTVKSSKTTTPSTSSMFFPDNDELENKIREYELKPDPEGTVYYDGSLHSSDLGRLVKDSDYFSDMMQGPDSDSRFQVDPVALDLQAQRRADVRRLNEGIMRMRMG